MDYISAKEASALWNITDQMIRRHCRNGRIPGSVQRNGTWYVPADAKKPTKLKPDIAPHPETREAAAASEDKEDLPRSLRLHTDQFLLQLQPSGQ